MALQELRYGKIGRFPVWVVGLLLAAAILVFAWVRNRRKGNAEARQSTESMATDQLFYDPTQTGVDGLPPGAIGDYLDSDPTNPAYPIGLTPNGIPGPVTNVQWTRLVFDWLVSKGADPALVERALAKYIQGLTLTAAERGVVNQAQTAFGAPPEGLILSPEGPAEPTPSTPTPSTPSPTTSSSSPQYITVGAGQSVYDTFAELGDISQVFSTVRALNPGIDSRIYWVSRPDNPDGNAPYFRSEMQVRIA